MAFEATGISQTIACDSGTASYPIPFQFQANTDIRAWLSPTDTLDTTTADTLELGVDYTISGDGSSAGGALVPIAPFTTGYLIMERHTSLDQTADYTPNDAFPAESHERQLDRLSMVDEELQAAGSSSPQLPVGQSFPNPVIPPLALANGCTLVWDAGLAQFKWEPNIAYEVTEEMQAILDQANAAAAAADQSADNSAASAAQAGTFATNSQNSANASAGSATAALGSQNAAKTSETNSALSAAQAQNSANQAAANAVLAGAYPNSATANVPRGLTQAGVGALTPGSGGAPGTYTDGTWSGGNFAVNPTFSYTISAGGQLSAFTVTGTGLYIGAAPAMPVPVFGHGLTGAAVALTPQFLVGNGQFYWAQSADNTKLLHYQNVGGVATADNGTGPLTTFPGLVATTNGIIGGRENGQLDTFSTNYTRLSLYGEADRPYVFGNSGNTWVLEPARATSPFPEGMQFRCAANTYGGITFLIPNCGWKAGDVIQIGMYTAVASTVANNAVIAGWSFSEIDGTAIPGAPGSGNLYTSTSANPWDANTKPFVSGNITIPPNAYKLNCYFPPLVTQDMYIDAVWTHKISVPATPTDIALIPAGRKRVQQLEDRSPTFNNVTLRRCNYTAKATVLAGVTGPPLVSPHNGWGQSYLTSAVPGGGFNGVEAPVQWATSAAILPIMFVVEIRTAAASEGKHPGNGRVIARGTVGVDPTSGGGDSLAFMLRDPATGLPKTVNPATDLLDRYAVIIFGLDGQGRQSTNFYQTTGDGGAGIDPAYPTGVAVFVNGGVGGSLGSGHASGFNLVMLTNPGEDYKTPSNEFAGNVLKGGEGVPTMIALPKKVYGVVGREANIFWWQIQRLDPRRVGFTVGTNLANASAEQDRLNWKPATAGTTNVVISSASGNAQVDSQTVAFIASPVSNAAKTLAIMAMGDSLIENEGIQNALNVIDQADAVTSLAWLGTHGTFKNEGYSGQALGAFFGPTLGTGRPNPFYNGATFDFNTWKNRSDIQAQLAAAGKTEPDIVIIEGGKVDVGQASNDGAATAACQGWASTCEAIVADILAKTSNTRIVIMAASAGPWPTPQFATYGTVWRVRRTWMQLASQQWAQFSGREANRIYVANTGCTMDPYVAWSRQWQPRSAAMIRDQVTLAAYAGASLGYNSGQVAYFNDCSNWFIKQGASGGGMWRPTQEADGWEWVVTDPVHWGLQGCVGDAEALWAVFKAIG
jgi:hypothetical protein